MSYFGQMAGSDSDYQWSGIDYINPIAWGQWAGSSLAAPLVESEPVRARRREVYAELGEPAIELGHRMADVGERGTFAMQTATNQIATSLAIAALVGAGGIYVAYKVLGPGKKR